MLFPRVYAIGAIDFLFANAASWAQESVDPLLVTMCLPDDCRVPVSQLSTQETHPFRFGFNIVDRNHPRWREYRSVIDRYTDARDCLLPEERTNENPDLLAIDWRRIGPRAGAEICLLRILSTLNVQDAVQNWLDFHDFDVSGPRPFITRSYFPESEQPSMWLSATWDEEMLHRQRPSVLYELFGLSLTTGYGVNIYFMEDGSVYNVKTVGGSTLN
ncbi:hypothetical protein [Boseongicola sp. H5]|uniref:hypothetical protein n=1 Tax=Boseongicola sp. H5 TaxID=2763261 RepID=UPI001D0BAC03|nr:hypothetical protein [Boseongicola sp. H5]